MLVSVAMITYGHENYIERAIDGVLMQKGDFEIELIIANDKSPDNTDQVIETILNTHPNASCIKYIRREKNFGVILNFIDTLKTCSGKYIAICEGDDYWTDELKLQKQVNFLENNSEYSLCCHNATVKYEDSDLADREFSSLHVSGDISMEMVLSGWIIPTASMVFRKSVLRLPEWVNKIYSGDYTLALLLRDSGKIYFFKDLMSVYRVSYTGTSMSATTAKNYEFVTNQHILLLEYFDKETHGSYSDLIHKRIVAKRKDLRFFKLKEKGVFYALIMAPRMFIKKVFKKISK